MSLKDELREEGRIITVDMKKDPLGKVLSLARRWRHIRIQVQQAARLLEEAPGDPVAIDRYLTAHRTKQRQEWRLAVALSLLPDEAEDVTAPGPVGEERGAPRGGA